MFTADDARELLQLFPPQKSADFLPKLILSSGGHGFVTLEFAQAQFRSRVTKGTQRIPVKGIATDLDVDPALVVQLVRTHPGLALLSADGSNIVTIDERDGLQRGFVHLLGKGLVDKSNFAKESDIDFKSVQLLMNTVTEQIIENDNHIWSTTYEQSVEQAVVELLKQALEQIQSVDIVSSQLPGSPPNWFAVRILKHVLTTQEFQDKIDLAESSDRVQCTPQRLLHDRKDGIVDDLCSGKQAFVDMQIFVTEFSKIFATFEDVKEYFREMSDVEVFSNYALSQIWISQSSQSALRVLEETGRIELTQHVPGGTPGDLRAHILYRLEESISALSSKSDIEGVIAAGTSLLTRKTYNNKLETVKRYGEMEALSEWRSLKANPDKEIKFSIANVLAHTTEDGPVLRTLLNDKTISKAVEETFWTTISSEEDQNEANFAEFWIERTVTRIQVYNEGLGAIEDQKLRDQLAELFATYAQKELVPDTISKARSQSLLLSRRTRKNVARLEAILKADKLDTSGILSALDKFNKKQGVATKDISLIEEAKKGMVGDMVRRMQKQKSSDGPVLFLTLVLILFAKHYNNVVYATGKFAPKLLKQLKAVLPVEQYEQVERWKEAAKTSSLTAEDRAEMKAMAEA